MRKTARTVVMLFLLAATLHVGVRATSADDPVVNGGFEDGLIGWILDGHASVVTSDEITHWDFDAFWQGSYVLRSVTFESRDGSSMLKLGDEASSDLDPSENRIRQAIEVEGRNARLSLWYNLAAYDRDDLSGIYVMISDGGDWIAVATADTGGAFSEPLCEMATINVRLDACLYVSGWTQFTLDLASLGDNPTFDLWIAAGDAIALSSTWAYVDDIEVTADPIAPTDTTPPVISASVVPQPNPAGWNNTNVTVHFDCTDGESGVAYVTPDITLVDEGAEQAVSGTCTDEAGNSSDATAGGINIDKTAPTVEVKSVLPNPAATSEAPALVVGATDALSGVGRVEYFIDELGPEGSGTSMPATDGAFDEVVEEASAALGDLDIGVHTIYVRGQDAADNWSSAASAVVVIYDPSAGFATGGGWIVPGGSSSDPGDSLPGLTGTDKANFGFGVKYQRGATTPTGQLEFRYRAGGFDLHSLGYDWLVVTNRNWAKFHGTATIRGLGHGYPFRVDVRDGNPNGGHQVDRFSIKIWAPGDDPESDEPTYKASGDIEGGNVIIHP